jgi:F-type H+-transporting ATPase subunit 6
MILNKFDLPIQFQDLVKNLIHHKNTHLVLHFEATDILQLFKMLSATSNILRLSANIVRVNVSRNLAASSVISNKVATDPIQGLFVEKIREYASKKKSSGGKLVDSTKETEDMLQNELDKIAKNYGGGKGVDMTKFPDFKWEDPQIDNTDLNKTE